MLLFPVVARPDLPRANTPVVAKYAHRCGRGEHEWLGDVMEMKKINSGRLRAIGYDARTRSLRILFDDGSTLQYGGVGEDTWRRFSSSGSAWSFYRDNIEEEFKAARVSGSVAAGNNPLEELFRKS